MLTTGIITANILLYSMFIYIFYLVLTHWFSMMKILNNLLCRPQLTIATSIIFCHRFFHRQSHAKNDRRVSIWNPNSPPPIVCIVYYSMSELALDFFTGGECSPISYYKLEDSSNFYCSCIANGMQGDGRINWCHKSMYLAICITKPCFLLQLWISDDFYYWSNGIKPFSI